MQGVLNMQTAEAYEGVSSSVVDRLLAEYPPAGADRLACYRVAGTSPHSAIARHVEAIVFGEFFSNTPEQLAEAYGPYEAASEFMLVVDRELGVPAGALRLIQGSPAGLKTLVDVSGPPLSLPTASVLEHHGIANLGNCWDVGAVAVLKPYRHDHLVSTALYGFFTAAGFAAGIEGAFCVLDSHAYRQLTEVFGLPLQALCGSEPFDYLGSSKSHACFMRRTEILKAVTDHVNALPADAREFVVPLARRVFYAEGLAKPISVE